MNSPVPRKLEIVIANGSTVEHYRQGGDLMVTLYHQDSDCPQRFWLQLRHP